MAGICAFCFSPMGEDGWDNMCIGCANYGTPEEREAFAASKATAEKPSQETQAQEAPVGNYTLCTAKEPCGNCESCCFGQA